MYIIYIYIIFENTSPLLLGFKRIMFQESCSEGVLRAISQAIYHGDTAATGDGTGDWTVEVKLTAKDLWGP